MHGELAPCLFARKLERRICLTRYVDLDGYAVRYVLGLAGRRSCAWNATRSTVRCAGRRCTGGGAGLHTTPRVSWTGAVFDVDNRCKISLRFCQLLVFIVLLDVMDGQLKLFSFNINMWLWRMTILGFKIRDGNYDWSPSTGCRYRWQFV